MIENVLVVLNYNDYNTIEKFLNNAIHIESIDKLIVVDNCSTDNSFEKLCAFESEKTDVIKTEKNGGYAYGNNFGVKYAMDKYSPKYVFISNPDVEFDDSVISSLQGLHKELETAGENVGCVSCQMKTTSDIDIKTAWKLPRYKSCILDNLIVLSSILKCKKYNYDYDYFQGEYSKVDVIHGSFFMVAMETFEKVGFFDEDTFLYNEENILAYKLKENKCQSYILNTKSYLHHHSVSVSKNIKPIRKRLDIAYDSRCVYLNKYLRINKIKKIFNGVTYRIGCFNYIILSKIISFIR